MNRFNNSRDQLLSDPWGHMAGLQEARAKDSRRIGALRILKTKDGQHRLQHFVSITSDDGYHSKTAFAWQDIPIVEEGEDEPA